jgi:hypothetical protein
MVGFWLGGFVLGTAGAIVGACMPYRHPVAVTISILWWGIYFGCFGAYIGALLGLWKNRTARRAAPRASPPAVELGRWRAHRKNDPARCI